MADPETDRTAPPAADDGTPRGAPFPAAAGTEAPSPAAARPADDASQAAEPAAAAAAGPNAGAGATRCGYVAMIGIPNAGKSTLVNALVGAKVSIVTHKVQTTRAVIRGIMIRDRAQVILVDTPGIFAPRRRLDRAMVRTAWANAYDADVVTLLVDARRGLDEGTEQILEGLESVRLPKLLLLTKIDLVRKEALLALAAAANERGRFDATFMISAVTGSGLDDLATALVELMPPGPWLYPEDQLSDLPERQLAAEITREHLMVRVHDELPYVATVETERWENRKDGSVKIEQVVFVERDSQKKIVIGEKGRTIRGISMAAREEIATLIGRPVHLFLFVKVRSAWGDDPERYREMGLDFPQ